MAKLKMNCPNCGGEILHDAGNEYFGKQDHATYESSRVPTDVIFRASDHIICCVTCMMDYKIKESETTYKRIHLIEAE